MNLRELYKEKGIKPINTTLLEKRENSMKKILEDKALEYDEWASLIYWLMGIEEDEITENILIKLEEIFCLQDDMFTKEDEKEMHILSGELVYRYCMETEEKRFPLMILCGYNVGYKIKSEKLYQSFTHLLNEWRLDIRKDENQEEMISFPDVAKIRKKMMDKQKDVEDEELEWELDQENWEGLIEVLEGCEKSIRSLARKNDQYKTMLDVQREESDILWWMINEWSDIYELPFRMLKKEQVALAAPIELLNMVSYYLGPFAIKQVLYKEVSLAKSEHQRMTLSQLIDASDEKLLSQINFDEWKSSKVQPVFLALWCKCKAGKEGWRGLFIRECEIDPDEVEMTLEEFAYQFYLELELAILPID